MSLKDEINRTETEKNKTKTVATNIDNKLVELGGQRAIDLSDVPNKIGAMVKENYKRVAKIATNTVIPIRQTIRIPINVSFTPTDIFLRIENGSINLVIDTKKGLSIYGFNEQIAYIDPRYIRYIPHEKALEIYAVRPENYNRITEIICIE